MPADPFFLDDPFLSTGEVARVSGAPLGALKGWIRPDRGIVVPGHRPGRARHAYTLLDAIKLAVMHDLTARVPVGPTAAEAAARCVAAEVLKQARRDDAGRPVADPNAFSRSVALALVMLDGAPHVGLIDAARPGEYMAFTGPWCRAHVVIPIGPLVADVLWRFLELQAEAVQS